MPVSLPALVGEAGAFSSFLSSRAQRGICFSPSPPLLGVGASAPTYPPPPPSFRTEQADFFFPFTPVMGRPADVRNLSSLCHRDRSGAILACLKHNQGRWNHLPTGPPIACHPEAIRQGWVKDLNSHTTGQQVYSPENLNGAGCFAFAEFGVGSEAEAFQRFGLHLL
jgi:hypothetical protein